MAGVRLEYDAAAVLAQLNAAAGLLDDPRRMLLDMAESLLATTQQRFRTQTGPDGSQWQALTPAYQRRKRKNKGRILVLNAYLMNQLAYQVNDNELLVGSNLPYAAIHQLGGTINVVARQRDIYFRRDKNGEVGQRFVKRSRSNFAQRVTIGPYTITIPARPYLGISTQDEISLVEIATRYLERPTA